MIIKLRGILGSDREQGDITEIAILNRIVRWRKADAAQPEPIEWEADPRHRKKIMEYFGVIGSVIEH